MGTRGFERIDDVLVHLQAEMDANIQHARARRNQQSTAIGAPMLVDVKGEEHDASWAKHKNLGDLFETMNARFEALAKQLRHPDWPLR